MALNVRTGKNTYSINILKMETKDYNKYWDNFNFKLYKEYINSKNQHLEEIITDIDIREITEMLELIVRTNI
jgi:hypothetical protein